MVLTDTRKEMTERSGNENEGPTVPGKSGGVLDVLRMFLLQLNFLACWEHLNSFSIMNFRLHFWSFKFKLC